MTASRARLLAMDDDEASLYILKKTLTPQYDLVTAQDWAEGINLLYTQHFDGIIVDLRMPMFDPEVFVNKLREAKPNIRVIVFSGFTDALERMADAPVDAILQKCCSEDELKRAVANALMPHKARAKGGK